MNPTTKARRHEEKRQGWEARRVAIVFLRDQGGYSWRQIAVAMNTTRGPVEGYYRKQKRIDRQNGGKVECECPAWFDCTFIHHPLCPLRLGASVAKTS